MQLIVVLLAAVVLSYIEAFKFDLSVHFGTKDTVRVVDEGDGRRGLLLTARTDSDRYSVYWTDKRAGRERKSPSLFSFL